MADQPIRIIVVDDNAQVHRGIAALIEIFDDLELVAHGNNGEEAITLCAAHQPDIILMDVIMPGMDGIEATRSITKQFPNVKILALSSFQDEESVRDMIVAGAIGYVIKTSSVDDLAHTIRAAYSGKAVFSSEVTQVLMHSTPHTALIASYGLTQREQEVLRLMVTGLNNGQIAEALTISLSTAKFHVSSILSKLSVTSRVEAVALAVEKNLVN